jgi:hypothetical protein
MRTPYDSSASRLSSWLMVVLGLVAYVGLLYGLTLLPLQFEVPLPSWGIAVVPPIVYGLLVLLLVHWPSPLRWLMGTALLSGLHALLTYARAPISAVLDPTLAGRPLPWVVPPPLPELVGLILLLVPLRDLLRARPRSPRERLAAGRSAATTRARAVPRPAPSSPLEERVAASEGLTPSRVEIAPEPQAPPMLVASGPPPVTTTVSAAEPESGDEIRRRRAAARAERRREMEGLRPPPRRSNTVLRIALDRVMGQLPPGTFLAPEDEVAASLRDPGHLLIPGDLIVTQLSEGVARVAWNDIADQFHSHLIGLSREEISEHLGDGLRLPLDEVVSQLPHDLFVADTPEIEVPGLDRIPVPFHPLSDPAASAPPASVAAPERPVADPPPVAVTLPPRPAPAPITAPEPPSYVDEPVVAPPAAKTIEPAPAAIATEPPIVPPTIVEPSEVARPVVEVEPPSVGAPSGSTAVSAGEPTASAPESREATVRISVARLTPDIPAEAFRQPMDQVAARMRTPGAILVPLSSVLPQLGEGMIRVGWDVVAAQFPHELMAVSDAEMAERLPQGLQLPIDEIIRQLSPDLFASSGPAADVSGLESFPAPFQPLLSDPAPETRRTVESVSAPAPSQSAAQQIAPTPEPSAPALVPDVVPEQPSVDVGAPIALLPGPSATVDGAVPLTPPVPPVSEPTPATESLVIESFVRTDSAVPVPEKTSELVRDVRLDGVPGRVEPGDDDAAPAPPQSGRAAQWTESEPAPIVPPPAEPARPESRPRWGDPVVAADLGSPSHALDAASSARLRKILGLLAPIAPFEAMVQPMEGLSVYGLTAPTVSAEVAVAATGLALPLLTDGRSPWPIDQLTLRGADTALVLTPLGGPRSPVLATAAPRGGALALLEILCRRAVDVDHRRSASTAASGSDRRRSLVAAAVPPAAVRQASSLTAFDRITASVLRDTEGEGIFYLFLPPGVDVPAVGAFAQDLQAVMRKAAGSGAVFRNAVLRSGGTIVVIQPEEVGHGRSLVVVAGGDVTRPGLAYRQVERAIATLAQA